MKKTKRIFSLILSLVVLISTFTAVGVQAFAAGDSYSSLKKKAQGLSNKKLVQFTYYDFDKDGKKEAFAVYSNSSKIDEEFGGVNVDIKFVSGERNINLVTNGTYYLTSRMLHSNCYNLFAIDSYITTESPTKLWCVKDGYPCSVSIPTTLESIEESKYFDCLIAMKSAYDGSSDGTGHTWKQYYFYFDGSKLVEYVGRTVSQSDIESISGGKSVISKIKKRGTLMSMYSLKNGIVHINYKEYNGFGYYYQNAELYYDGKKLHLKGRYNDAKDAKSLDDSGYGGTYYASSQSAYTDYPTQKFTKVSSVQYKYVASQKATLKKNGKKYKVCKKCGKRISSSTVYSPKKFTFASAVYSGKNKRPKLTIKDSKGKKISSSYYTVTYPKKSVKVGKYTAKVKFKGLYSGTKTVSYTVKPKGTSITKLTAGKGKLTVNLAKQKTQTTGYEIQYSTSKKFKGAKKATLKNSNSSKTIKKLKRSKKYYVRVRTYKKVGKTTCYSSWSKTKTVKTK